MKTSTMRWMIAAAALVVATASASAQTYKAEIPMAFRASGTSMAPGSYEIRVSRSSTTEAIFIHNSTTDTSIVLMAGVKGDPPTQWKQDGDPRLSFSCTDGACSLSKLWSGSDTYAYTFPTPKARAGNVVAHRSDVVTLTMVKAR